MDSPRADLPTCEMIVQGLHHAEALAFFEATEALAEPFAELNAHLAEAWKERVRAEREAAPRRARVKLLDLDLDALVMAFAEVVRDLDAAAGGQRAGVAFPDEVEPIVSPIGEAQAREVRALLGRLTDHEELADLREPWSAVLGEQLDRYEAAIASRDAALERLARAREAEAEARRAWLEAVVEHIAVIEEDLPDSDLTEALFFPAS